MSKITDNELSMLSEEERAALEEDDAADAGSASADDEAENDDALGASGAEPAGEGAAAGAKPAAAEGETPTASADAQDESAAPLGEDAPFIPRYTAQPVLDYDAKIAALDEQFENGDITLKEYNAQRDTLTVARAKAEIAAEQEEQIALQRWEWEVERFIRDTAKVEDIDYNKPLLNAALDAAVKALANQKDANGNLVNADKNGEWFLAEAHKQVQAELGVKPAAASGPVASRKAPQAPRNVPVTLSQLPAAQELTSPGEEDPFAYIDKLFAQGKVEEGEMALAKLSKVDERRYLEGR